MKKWLLSELFYPLETSTGYFMTKIAEKISKSEPYGINVICGPENYDSDNFHSTSMLDTSILLYRVSLPKLNKNNLIERSLRMLILSIKMAFKLFILVKKGDKVYIVTNPAPLLVLTSIIKQLTRFNFIIIVHDVFPENMLPGKIIKRSSLSYKLLASVYNWAYQQADKVICVGEDMKELMLKKTHFDIGKISVIRNWADCDQIYPLNLSQDEMINYYNLPELDNKIIIQFAGNIGRLQGLPDFLEVFKSANNMDLALIFIGDGAMKENLVNKVKVDKIANVHFINSLSRSDQNNFLNASHIGLVSLNEGMYGLGVPSKSYNILAAGIPILFIGDKNSEIDRNIYDYKIGWSFDWQEKEELKIFLKSLNYNDLHDIRENSIRSREVVLKNFDREVILAHYDSI